MFRFYITFLLLVLFNALFGQSLYFVDSDGAGTYSFGTINIDDQCSEEILYQSQDLIKGITVHSDANIYAVFNCKELKRWDFLLQDFIYEIDLPDSTYWIASSSDGLVYCSTIDSLYSIEIANGQVVNYGSVGINNSPISLGGLTFVNGELYAMNKPNSFGEDSKMIKINLSSPMESALIVDQFNFFPWPAEGLTSAQFSCDSALLYFNVLEGFGITNLYEYDLQTGIYEVICDYPTSRNIDFLAHPSEPLLFECAPEIDLDTTDTQDLDYIALVYCNPQPYTPFADAPMAITTDATVDSIWIGLTWVFDGPQEFLYCNGPLPIPCNLSNGGLLFDNSIQQLANDSLLSLIANHLFYENTAMPISGGWRDISVVAYHNVHISDTALLILPLDDILLPNAGTSGEVTICEDDTSIIDLFDFLGGVPEPSGIWTPVTSLGNGLFDPSIDPAGLYVYTVSANNPCPDATASVAVTVLGSPVFSLGPDTSLCTGNLLPLQPNIVQGDYQWQDNSNSANFTVQDEGLYWLEVTDTNGCQWRDSIFVGMAGNVQTDSIATPCTGDIFDFMGTPLTSDTTICQTATSVDGCDSTFCLNLTFQPLPTAIHQATFCENGQYTFHGTIYDQPGTYEATIANPNGCDSALTLILEQTPLPTATYQAGFCENGSYIFHGNIYDQPGTYETTETNPSGCDSLLTLILEEWPLPDVAITGGGVLCEGQTTDLTATGSFVEAVWSTGATGTGISIGQAGIYSTSVSDGNGCTATASQEVVEMPAPSFEALAQPPSCPQVTDGSLEILILDGVAPLIVLVNGQPLLPPYIVNGLPDGLYQIEVTDANGCSSTTMVEVPPAEPLALAAIGQFEIFEGETATVVLETNVTDIASVTLQPNEWVQLDGLQLSISPPVGQMDYEVGIITSDGCMLTTSFSIVVKPIGGVYVPNVFSPNSDGLNDVFKAFAADGAEALGLKVFDRWGGMVFDGSGTEGWDGTHRGKPASAGVYVFLLETRKANGETEMRSGEVVLVR